VPISPRQLARGIRHNGLVDADVVVIGAGALGLSTALHCALAGRSVAVVERHTAGSQASGRAAGLFKSVQADELRTRLARRSIAKAITFADWAGTSLPVASPGSFLIARTARHRQFLGRELAQSRGWGADVREATRAQLAGRLSYYQSAGDDFGLWCPEDIYIDEPASLVQACLAACRLHGAVVTENEPVTGISVTAGRVAGVETSRRPVAAPVVVDAAGGWVRHVAGLAGARVPVAVVRHQLLITAPTALIDPADPITRVADAAVYLRPARGGLMFGGFEPDPTPRDPRHQPPSFTTDDVPLDLGVLRQLAAQITAEVPAASTAPVAEHRGGLFTMSPDGRFIAGPVPDLPGLWVASGCNGSGFSSSLAIGEALATWITSGAPPPGMTALSPGRFGPLPDDALLTRGLWQYAHYYDPVTTASGSPDGGLAPWLLCPARRDGLTIGRLLSSQEVGVGLSRVDQTDGQQLQGDGAAEEGGHQFGQRRRRDHQLAGRDVLAQDRAFQVGAEDRCCLQPDPAGCHQQLMRPLCRAIGARAPGGDDDQCAVGVVRDQVTVQRVLHAEHSGGDPCALRDLQGQFPRRGNVDKASRANEPLNLSQLTANLQRTGAHRQELTQVPAEASCRELFLAVRRGEVEPGQHRRGITDRVTVRLVTQRGHQHDIGDVPGGRVVGRRDQGGHRTRLASGSQRPHRRGGQPAVGDRYAQAPPARCQSLVGRLARLGRARRDR
jgi:glycine/D-amino acid oxidase-like deaminating enzyme